MNKKDIVKKLKDSIDSKRYEHTLGVAYTAASLAMKYDYDVNTAYMAGLLHDCAKGMTHKERLEYCRKYNIDVTNVEYDNPSLLHAKVGARMAYEEYEIDNSDIIDAIRYHTTGRAQMSLLEEIVFVADYIEPNRDHDNDLTVIRKKAFEDLHKATLHIYKNTVSYLESGYNSIDTTTMDAYNYYKTLTTEN